MHSLLEGSTGQANHAVLGPSQNTYDGNKVDTADKFHMTINGVSVGVSVPSAINDGEAMSSAAAKLTTAVQNAVGDYNSARGLSEGVYDEKSGLTGLTKNEFTVKEGDNGNFQVLYSGKEPVEFSFSDVGERTVAQGLGLATGGSSGGAGALSLQIGDTAEDYNSVWVSVEDMHTTALGIKSVDVSTQNGASEAMKSIKEAINKVSDARGGLGALQNKLEHTIGNLGVMRENIQNAESLIRDTDVAEQMMSYTKNNILNQSAQAMLAQANQLPQGVMQLLQG
ncbi:MAG: hypothetical protein J5449_08195 [Oscillospiraceae bacterium]|nr:hypothetical protein [Oscillospiraceae bacterium]